MRKIGISLFLLLFFAVLIGCSSQSKSDEMNMDHSKMNHGTSSEVKDGLTEAVNPAFPIGSEAIIQAEHMAGMKGAEATIVEAYDTYIYSVSYTPTDGGAKVENHKWVFQGEIQGLGKSPAQVGDEVVLLADHLPGMNGAQAIVESVEKTTVYMIDYTPTSGGERVTNHKWVIESELEKKP